jgi:hypothetical protein
MPKLEKPSRRTRGLFLSQHVQTVQKEKQMQDNSSTTLAIRATQAFDFGAGKVDVGLLDTGDVGISVVRLAEALGCDDHSIRRMINRDKVLKEYVGTITTRTGVTMRPTLFLQRTGVFLLCAKMQANRIKDPIRKKALQTFQHWAAEKLSGDLFKNPKKAELERVGQAFDQALFGNLPERVETPKTITRAPIKTPREKLLESFSAKDFKKLSVRERLKLLEQMQPALI